MPSTNIGSAALGSDTPGSAASSGRAAATTIDRLARKWRRSQVLRPRLLNIAHLLSGNVANAAIMAVSTVIAARSLGVAAYGILALVLTVGRVAERMLRFESWQPLIRFAAQPDVEGRPDRMSELMLYGLLLDVGSALLAAVLTVIGGYLLMPVIGLKPEHMPLVAIYALAIAFNIRGMATAALRLNGQFFMLAYVQLFASLLRVGLAIGALAMGMDLLTFVIIWTFAQIVDSTLFNIIGFRTLGKLGIASPLKADWRNLTGKFPGFMRFAWSTNLSSTLRTFTQEADTLLVGALAGPGAVGFYHIAKRFAKVAQQVGQMVQAVIYPDMARMWAKADYLSFRRITARIQLALAGVGLAILGGTWLLGGVLISFAFGQEFAATYPLLLAQLVAVVLIMHAAPSRSALLAMNRPGFVLGVAVASTAVFGAIAFTAIPHYGALGANYAHIGFAAVTAIAMDLAWWKGSRRPLEPAQALA